MAASPQTAVLIVTTRNGEVCDTELIDAIKKYQQDIQYNPDYINYNEVVNLTGITDIKLSIEEIKYIGKTASTTDHNMTNRKLAIIVSSNLAFGLARMYEAYSSFSKTVNKQICVFKNEKKRLARRKIINNALELNNISHATEKTYSLKCT